MSEQHEDAVVEETTEESSPSPEESQEDSESTVESKSVPYARFKEVNEELKRLKQERLEAVTKKEEPKVAKSDSGYSEEDLFIIKSLDSVEELERVRKIAKLNDSSLADAMKSDEFSFWKQARAEEDKKEKASLEASRGSGTRGKKKTLQSPGLTKEEHKELWKQKTGR